VFAYVHFRLNSSTEAGEALSFSIGDFLSFNSALGQFNAAMLGLMGAMSQIITMVPLYKRAAPILHAVPETRADSIDPGELSGHIELSNVTFRYLPDMPPVLNDLSITIRPGEYVAFVGSSGSGKSTILRLMLGFETPEAGGVYFDGQDLSGLDIGAVRRQIGVVLQGSKLGSGSIFDNIVGSAPLSQDDAWQAAREAGLEQDIKDLPMGMHTMLSEGASTLSGGQRQRLMIARALVLRPRILMLDEATSALDNYTQSVVNQSLDKQNLTRIVVAHRLSTIINAHRIVVLKQGQIVETGRYSELMARDGEFAALARRQLL
jgi:ATP-binding cassette subfamily C protein